MTGKEIVANKKRAPTSNSSSSDSSSSDSDSSSISCDEYDSSDDERDNLDPRKKYNEVELFKAKLKKNIKAKNQPQEAQFRMSA